MKLQSLGIIFIIIIFPMILILSYYLSLQVDTLTLQNQYENALIDATNDAISAFELNTANENLSNNSDALRSIVDASTNTFVNTLSTSIGLSNAQKERLQPYIPAILYTMYDGYYIYSPTKTPVIEEEIEIKDGLEYNNGAKMKNGELVYKKSGGGETTNVSEAEFKIDYVLKSYMPYSATYQDVNNKVTINYTLDNYMSISGKINDIYYTKSGYYIKDSLITYCDIGNWDSMGQDELKEYCENESNTITITVNGITITTSEGSSEVQTANRKAITYYLTNTAFSKWVNTKLGFVKGSNLKAITNDDTAYSSQMNIYHNFSSETNSVFSNVQDPENEDSVFNNHKYNIIKNSIQYNLNLAISSYSEMYSGLTFEMPILTDSEWEEITKKISIVSFLQGLDCGLKNFNGYAVVSSTNNEMTVIPEEIYYVPADKFNDEAESYHRLDCDLIKGESGNFISFVSKEVKYDDVYNKNTTKHEYDHKNLACYDCIVQNNYANFDSSGDGVNDKKIKLRAYLGIEEDDDEGITYINTSVNPNLKKAYYIAVAKERQNLYKTTAYSKNEGILIVNNSDSADVDNIESVSKFEITLKNNNIENVIIKTIKLKIGGKEIEANAYGSTTSNQTIPIKNTEWAHDDGRKKIEVDGTNINVLSIKVIYK